MTWTKSSLLFVLMAFVVVGAWAGGSAEQEVTIPDDIEWVTPDRIGNPNANIVIRYGVTFAYSHQVDTPSRREYLMRAAEEWARENPNVQLIPQLIGGTQAEILATQLEEAATGQGPDFTMIDGQWIPMFYDFLQPLDDYVSEEELDDWFQWAKDGAMIDPNTGELKSLWFTTNAVGLWYRRDLIPEPPRDWDEFIETAHWLMDDHGFNIGLLATGHEEQISYGNVIPMFYGLGGDLVDDQGAPIFGEGENRDAMIEVMGFWDRAVKEGVVPERILDISAAGDNVSEAAEPNNLAMFLSGSWLLSRMNDVLGDEVENWDFTFTPQRDASVTGQSGQVPGGYNWAFFTRDEEKLAYAVDFVKHVYAGRQGMADFGWGGGYTPVRHSIMQEDQRFVEDRFHQAFAEVVEAGRPRPGVQAYGAISEFLQEAWQNVILQRETPEQAVDRAFERTLQQIR